MPVEAADLTVPELTERAFEPEPMARNWSGFYGGLHGGFGHGNSSGTTSIFGTPVGAYDFDFSGGLLGAQAGFNYQAGSWVYGVEADISLAGLEGTTDAFGGVAEYDMLASLRGRLGHDFGGTLIYGTAGMALAHVNIAPGFGTFDEAYRTGWTGGAGFERMLSANTSLKAEYAYTHFDDETYNYITGVIVALPTQATGGSDLHTFKVGLNYHF